MLSMLEACRATRKGGSVPVSSGHLIILFKIVTRKLGPDPSFHTAFNAPYEVLMGFTCNVFLGGESCILYRNFSLILMQRSVSKC